MSSDSARGLLFGLLAFQNGFIDREALLKALATWIGDKSRPIDRLLLRDGVIDESLRGFLVDLVSQHLQRHGGDADASLASLAVGRSTVQRLAALHDPEVEATLTFLGKARRDVDNDSGPVPTDSSRGDDGASGRFQVLRKHAEGGLGVVSVALDRELGREVALKEVRESNADDPASRRRFLLEAEITGGLEHPGIVPVYALGRYDNGRPYYAMRFIRGETLRQAIERFHRPAGEGASEASVEPSERVLGLRQLLRRFLDVCNAVDYAHSRGVLHRDLKPSNMIVGKHGETLVVDWGLAKATGSSGEPSEEGALRPPSGQDSIETLQGSPLGTPAYMSPEQARGDLAEVGPRSDVYSLGATLYCLITGRPPIGGETPGEMKRRVMAGEFPRPRQVVPSIDKGLEAICLKAMATQPERRYDSCRALVDDIERWLADEPISALRDSRAARLGRWSRRHRTLVATAAVALSVATPALAALAIVQTKARADLGLANQVLDRQRRFAETQEDLAIQAVKRFRDVVIRNEALKKDPALEGLRKDLLVEPLNYFSELRRSIESSGDLRPRSLVRVAEAAHDHAHLADEIGDREDALRSHVVSQGIWERLTREDPEDRAYQSELGRLHHCRGQLLVDTGRPEEAMAAFEESLAIRSKLAAAVPENGQYALDLANTLENIATRQVASDRLEDALRNHEAAFAIRNRLVQERPENAEYSTALCLSLNNLAALWLRQGELDRAFPLFQRALTIRRELAQTAPDDEANLEELAGCHNNMGLILFQTRRFDEALEALTESCRIKERLAEAQPTVTDRQAALASSYYNLGTILNEMRREEDAAPWFEKSLPRWEALTARHPESPEYASTLGAALNNLATIDIHAGRLEEARDRLKRAISAQKRARAAGPADTKYREYLANHLANLISIASEIGRRDEAVEAMAELKEIAAADARFAPIIEKLVAVTRLDLPEAVATRLVQARAAMRSSRFAAAERLADEALETQPKLADERDDPWRYFAARAALLTAAGKALDEPRPDPVRAAELRTRALGRLKAELQQWEKDRALAPPVAQRSFAEALGHWLKDAALASVRDEDALNELPEEEKSVWLSFWEDVSSHIRKVQGPN